MSKPASFAIACTTWARRCASEAVGVISVKLGSGTPASFRSCFARRDVSASAPARSSRSTVARRDATALCGIERERSARSSERLCVRAHSGVALARGESELQRTPSTLLGSEQSLWPRCSMARARALTPGM